MQTKIIDCETKGNVIRFYLGDPNRTDYWGDDWDDAPFDCNAGRVYDEYVEAVKDVSFPFDCKVIEPDSVHCSHYWSRENMKERKVPCLIVVPESYAEDWNDSFFYWLGRPGVKKYYFGDDMV